MSWTGLQLILAVGSSQAYVLLVLDFIRRDKDLVQQCLTVAVAIHVEGSRTNTIDMHRITPLTGASSSPPTGSRGVQLFSAIAGTSAGARVHPFIIAHLTSHLFWRIRTPYLAIQISTPATRLEQNCPPFRRLPCPRLVFLVLASLCLPLADPPVYFSSLCPPRGSSPA